MIDLLQVVAVVLVTTLSTVESQVVSFTSHLNGQFACPNETVTYSCSVNETGIVMGALPFFNSGFGVGDPISTTRVSTDARFTLTLIERTSFLTAQLQVPRATATNITCSNPSGSSVEVIPLIMSSSPENAINVRLIGLTGNTGCRSVVVKWDPPTNPQFDVAYYRVEVLVGGIVSATGISTSNMMELEVLFYTRGTIDAQVYTVSRCNDEEAGPMRSVNVLSATYRDFYAAFLVPLLIIAILIGVIIGISIGTFRCYKQQKNKIASLEHQLEGNEMKSSPPQPSLQKL